jgi:hypothetical protein
VPSDASFMTGADMLMDGGYTGDERLRRDPIRASRAERNLNKTGAGAK